MKYVVINCTGEVVCSTHLLDRAARKLLPGTVCGQGETTREATRDARKLAADANQNERDRVILERRAARVRNTKPEEPSDDQL